jgi:hypothetical protein
MAEEENNPVSLLLKYLAAFGGVIGTLTAVLYGAGFLATRAHLNMLGVWTGVPIVNEEYLYQGGLFFLNSIFSLASVIPFAVVLAGGLYGLKVLLSWVLRGLSKLAMRIRRIGRLTVREARITSWRTERLKLLPMNVSGTTLGLTCLTMVLVFGVPIFYGKSLSIQNLLFQPQGASESVPWLAKWLQQHILEGRQGSLSYYYGLLVAGILMTGFLLWYVQRDIADVTHRILRLVLGTILIVQILLLPLNYGVLVQSVIYPRVLIDTQEVSRTPVWLLFETSEEVIVYDIRCAKKGISTIKKKDVKELRIFDQENILKNSRLTDDCLAL